MNKCIKQNEISEDSLQVESVINEVSAVTSFSNEEAALEDDLDEDDYHNELIESVYDRSTSNYYPKSIIMLPNKELCNQVYNVASSIVSNLEDVDISIGLAPHSDSRDPYPSIVICTPSFFNRFLRGTTIYNPEVFRSIKQVVLDEVLTYTSLYHCKLKYNSMTRLTCC